MHRGSCAFAADKSAVYKPGWMPDRAFTGRCARRRYDAARSCVSYHVIVYIHGFNSSPASFKARLVQQHLAALGTEHDFMAPKLPHSPRAASQLLSDIVKRHPHAALIGSSLGGYYA